MQLAYRLPATRWTVALPSTAANPSRRSILEVPAAGERPQLTAQTAQRAAVGGPGEGACTLTGSSIPHEQHYFKTGRGRVEQVRFSQHRVYRLAPNGLAMLGGTSLLGGWGPCPELRRVVHSIGPWFTCLGIEWPLDLDCWSPLPAPWLALFSQF